jgi:hypothetical protein
MISQFSKKVNNLIYINEFYEWYPFFETVEGYEVEGRVMACQCNITLNPVIHDIEINSIMCIETFADLTDVVDHEHIENLLERFIF